MNKIVFSQREYVNSVAGYNVRDEEIREFLADYDDWVRNTETDGDYRDQEEAYEAQSYCSGVA